VADTMKSGWQHVQQEAAHELLGTQRHRVGRLGPYVQSGRNSRDIGGPR
jgi:hypothetical protein